MSLFLKFFCIAMLFWKFYIIKANKKIKKNTFKLFHSNKEGKKPDLFKHFN